jgi:hypothetical protein
MKSVAENISILLALCVAWAIVAHCTACHDAKQALAEAAFDADLSDCETQYATLAEKKQCVTLVLAKWHIAEKLRDAGGDR